MAIWNTKFDHKNGESRQCKKCGDTFHAKRPRWVCVKCVNAKQKIIETTKRAQYKKKDVYPFDTRGNTASLRFCKIRTALSNAWKQYRKTGDKSVVIAHYDKQLQEIKDNGIMQWIVDRRTSEAKKEMNPMIMAKSNDMIKKEYPDTRGWYEQ